MADLEAALWLQLEAAGPSWSLRLRVARVTARRPRERIPGTYLAKLLISVPAALFTDELPPPSGPVRLGPEHVLRPEPQVVPGDPS